jgi:hypothetical protein
VNLDSGLSGEQAARPVLGGLHLDVNAHGGALSIMQRAMRRATTKDLARLKALLEGGERAN